MTLVAKAADRLIVDKRWAQPQHEDVTIKQAKQYVKRRNWHRHLPGALFNDHEYMRQSLAATAAALARMNRRATSIHLECKRGRGAIRQD